MDLSDFLLARFAEEEADAMVGWRWKALTAGEYTRLQARVLAECDAKRRIVAWHRLTNGLDDDDMPVRGCGNCIPSGAEAPHIIAGPCLTVRLLAFPYADHPDCDEAWRP